MTISLLNSKIVCKAKADETILLALARAGIILSAPCGGRNRCGKCKVRLVSGQIGSAESDAEGWVRACLAVPLSDLTIECPENYTLIANELSPCSMTVRPQRAGVALDIGTTTISARLVDLDTSSPIDTISELNDQRLFGADVMSRISAARDGKTAELFSLINRQTEKILKTFMDNWDLKRIEKLSVSGNTTMLHLFLNTDPSGMGVIPFTPVFLEEKEIKGADLSLSAETVSILPSISAFIGGDVTAGLAVLDILHGPEPSLFIDIGTNGEMALFNKGNILCCSTAAGPAFEGAEISCGMGGLSGAISAVELINENTVTVSTIGNTPALGICGSGLIDAVAVMLKQGIIDETGLMTTYPSPFVLAPGISIINNDIRQFQLAKSAIYSGIKILCKNAGLSPSEIKNVYIAGGFGFFINKKSSCDTGLIPKELIDSLTICGNLSLQGAEESLSSKSFIEKCKQIISRCSVIDLSMDAGFMDEFAENMLFSKL